MVCIASQTYEICSRFYKNHGNMTKKLNKQQNIDTQAKVVERFTADLF